MSVPGAGDETGWGIWRKIIYSNYSIGSIVDMTYGLERRCYIVFFVTGENVNLTYAGKMRQGPEFSNVGAGRWPRGSKGSIEA